MRETAGFFLYMFACLMIGAALTVPVVQAGWFDAPPARIMGRITQLLMLVGLWPFLHWCGVANRAALGFAPAWPAFRRGVIGGWVLGVLMLGALVLALVALGIRAPAPLTTGLLWRALAQAVAALVGGLLIGLLEELFFRGALFAAIRRRAGLASAAVGSAGLYALVHFLKPAPLPPGTVFDGAGALAMFSSVFTGLFDPAHVDSLVALFVAGLLLALVRERSGHIGWCIGLHAGWVFVIGLTRRVTDDLPAAPLAGLTGSYDGVIGWLAAGWVGLVLLGLWLVMRLRPGGRAA